MQQVHVQFTGFGYVVRIGSNLLPTLGTEARAASRSPKAFVITNEQVAEYYLDPAVESLRDAGLEAASETIKGHFEEYKTLHKAGELYDAMLRFGMDRGSVVVALGGGVITDLAGFVAATYMRGIAWIAVPTSLLGQVDASVGGKTAVNHGQVDASVGGKTGVDHPECKNLIGAFHQPSAVLADVTTLATLPQEELRTGLAEVVKHAVIRDAALFDTLEAEADAILARDPKVLENVVARNVEIKADVVMADEREGGLRRILNYGHTVGHALESLSMETASVRGGTPMRHGRAVALGMMAEARIAQARGTAEAGLVQRQRTLLERFGLPVGLDAPPDAERCLQIMRHDKKARSGRLRFILPQTIGAVCDTDDVTDDEIREALRCLAAGC